MPLPTIRYVKLIYVALNSRHLPTQSTLNQNLRKMLVDYYWLTELILVISSVMIHRTTSTNAIMHPRAAFCSNATMFANNSAYQTNLNTLLSSLLSNVNNPSGYYQTMVSNPTSETIYGHFLCFGTEIPRCRYCVKKAITEDIPKTKCPNRKVALIWYYKCMVRYSNVSFFNSMNTHPVKIFRNFTSVIGNATEYIYTLENTISHIIVRAAEGGSRKKFAIDFVNNSGFAPIYAVGQCTPDLTPNDCYMCLNSSIQMCTPSTYCHFMRPSCVVRYDSSPFFNLSYFPALSKPPPASPPSDHNPVITPSEKKISIKVIIPAAAVLLVILTVLLSLIACLWKNQARTVSMVTNTNTFDQDFAAESLQYDFATLMMATNNFSDENKVGEGGFGGVYKGTLSNGNLIAVKRLSTNSSQGVQEFKNEVLLVAKLQHRNLVRLLGFCYEGPEKLLVYEYVANKSLNNFLFNNHYRRQLDWQKRYNIIRGIARGLLYLHHDSQHRIIHRDLKASNILMDGEMNPKISDFGTSRIFGMDHSKSNYTNRVVGTYGYMAPEYALEGQFSIKSDVYSFGVLVLEIVSGRKISSFLQSDGEDLLSFAWTQWDNGTPQEFLDPTIRDTCSNNIDDVVKCIHIGLLCTQESIEDRPTMANVVLTIESHSATLPIPAQRGTLARNRLESTKSTPSSFNYVSITEPEPR